MFRLRVAFQFLQLDIMVTDYAMSGFFKKLKTSVIHFFMFRICFDIFLLDFKNAWLNLSIFSEL